MQKNITLAAKHLFISQPALTKQLSKLEKSWASSCLTAPPTRPSPPRRRGSFFWILPGGIRSWSRTFKTTSLSAAIAPPAVPVRIATTHRGGGYAGIHTAAFMAAYPNICLEYLDTSARKCEELLEEEQVDLAIYTDPILSSKLEYMPLEEDLWSSLSRKALPFWLGWTSPAILWSTPWRSSPGASRDPLAAVHSCHPRAGAVLRGEMLSSKNIVSLHWTLSGWNTSIPATRSCRAVAASHCSRTPRSSSTLMATANRRFMASRKVTLYTATSSLPGKRAAPSPPMQKPSGVLW